MTRRRRLGVEKLLGVPGEDIHWRMSRWPPPEPFGIWPAATLLDMPSVSIVAGVQRFL